MKKVTALILAIVCLMALSGCGQESSRYGPFKLTVSCGEESVEAKIGTHSWSSPNYSAIACGSGLPGGKASMSCLSIDGTEQLTAKLEFEVIPDSVSVACWSGSYWDEGGSDTEKETVTVQRGEDGYTFPLKEGVYIYMVSAKWDYTGKYGGTIDYTFYTE